MPYKKILLALDMNDKGTFLFEEALGLAYKMDAELGLVCCFEQDTVAEAEDRVTTVTELDMSESQKVHNRQRSEQLTHVRSWLESLAHTASEKGVVTRVHAEEGKPAQRICELAAHWGADLIVLGHSGRHPIKELLIGNINSHVVRCAHCAVLITKRV
ncbi:MAG: universal stress protein [Desulfobacteraceae bacterium]|nr:universal stress protein [Desulfobacteraceae bacterium]